MGRVAKVLTEDCSEDEREVNEDSDDSDDENVAALETIRRKWVEKESALIRKGD